MLGSLTGGVSLVVNLDQEIASLGNGFDGIGLDGIGLDEIG
jgi:hypothetical protein